MTTTTSPTAIRPFRVSFSDEELADLRRRILASRLPERETVTDQSQGVQLATTQALVRYWGSDYDWKKCEAKLNALPLPTTPGAPKPTGAAPASAMKGMPCKPPISSTIGGASSSRRK